MTKKVANQSLSFSRGGRRIAVKAGDTYDFTDAEIAAFEKQAPRCMQDPPAPAKTEAPAPVAEVTQEHPGEGQQPAAEVVPAEPSADAAEAAQTPAEPAAEGHSDHTE